MESPRHATSISLPAACRRSLPPCPPSCFTLRADGLDQQLQADLERLRQREQQQQQQQGGAAAPKPLTGPTGPFAARQLEQQQLGKSTFTSSSNGGAMRSVMDIFDKACVLGWLPLAAARLPLRPAPAPGASALAGCVLHNPAQRSPAQPSIAQHGFYHPPPSASAAAPPRLCCFTFPPLLQVLIADFFFILFALGWLGAGLAERSALQSTVRACLPAFHPPTPPARMRASQPASSVPAGAACLRPLAHSTWCAALPYRTLVPHTLPAPKLAAPSLLA